MVCLLAAALPLLSLAAQLPEPLIDAMRLELEREEFGLSRQFRLVVMREAPGVDSTWRQQQQAVEALLDQHASAHDQILDDALEASVAVALSADDIGGKRRGLTVVGAEMSANDAVIERLRVDRRAGQRVVVEFLEELERAQDKVVDLEAEFAIRRQSLDLQRESILGRATLYNERLTALTGRVERERILAEGNQRLLELWLLDAERQLALEQHAVDTVRDSYEQAKRNAAALLAADDSGATMETKRATTHSTVDAASGVRSGLSVESAYEERLTQAVAALRAARSAYEQRVRAATTTSKSINNERRARQKVFAQTMQEERAAHEALHASLARERGELESILVHLTSKSERLEASVGKEVRDAREVLEGRFGRLYAALHEATSHWIVSENSSVFLDWLRTAAVPRATAQEVAAQVRLASKARHALATATANADAVRSRFDGLGTQLDRLVARHSYLLDAAAAAWDRVTRARRSIQQLAVGREATWGQALDSSGIAADFLLLIRARLALLEAEFVTARLQLAQSPDDAASTELPVDPVAKAFLARAQEFGPATAASIWRPGALLRSLASRAPGREGYRPGASRESVDSEPVSQPPIWFNGVVASVMGTTGELTRLEAQARNVLLLETLERYGRAYVVGKGAERRIWLPGGTLSVSPDGHLNALPSS
jgi:hypothetical protein